MEPVEHGIALHRQVAGHVAAEVIPCFGIGGANSGWNGNVARQSATDQIAEPPAFAFATAEPVEDQQIGAVFKFGRQKTRALRQRPGIKATAA